MAAGWKALAACPEIELKVIAWETIGIGLGPVTAEGLDCQLLDIHERENTQLFVQALDEFSPDLCVVTGWFHRPYRLAAAHAKRRGCRTMMVLDTPWRGFRYQFMVSIQYKLFFRTIDFVFVPGDRAWQTAKQLGFAESKIMRGAYCYDESVFWSAEQKDKNKQAEEGFLFCGRLAPEKGLDVLVKAYEEYRSRFDSPWPLNCVGIGPLKNMVMNFDGITSLGFANPNQLADLYRSHAALVLPSLYEPWGVVICESLACGTPVIASGACGATPELIRPYFNGLSTETSSVESLANAMTWMHMNQPDIAFTECKQLALPFSSQNWAKRIVNSPAVDLVDSDQ